MKHDDSMMRNVAKQTGSLVVGVLILRFAGRIQVRRRRRHWSARHYFTEPVPSSSSRSEPAVLLIGASLVRVIRAHRTRLSALGRDRASDCQSARANQLQ